MLAYASAGKHAAVMFTKPMQATSELPRPVARTCSRRCSARKVAVVCWRLVSTPWMAVAKPAPTATSPTEMTKTAASSSARGKPPLLPAILMLRINLFIALYVSHLRRSKADATRDHTGIALQVAVLQGSVKRTIELRLVIRLGVDRPRHRGDGERHPAPALK